MSINAVEQNEGHAGPTTFTVTVALSSSSLQPVPIHYATAPGTASAGSDYAAISSSLVINPGLATGAILIDVHGDATPEATETTETFFINLTGAENATIADNQGVGTITNDDGTNGNGTAIPVLSWCGLIVLLAGLIVIAFRRI